MTGHGEEERQYQCVIRRYNIEPASHLATRVDDHGGGMNEASHGWRKDP